MAIGRIGGYSSYNSWLSGMYGKNSSKKNTSATNTDLQALMKLADEVRSPAYRKNMKDLFSSSDKKDSSSSNVSSGEIGSVSSEMALATASDNLKKAANSVSAMGAKDLENADTVASSVKKFTEAYNNTLDAMSKSDSVNALSEGLRMTDTVKMHAKSLKRIGITIGSDNKLSVNEDVLKKADKNVVKSLLTGNYSPVKRIADRAEDITAAAKNKAQTTAFRNQVYGTGTSAGNSYGYGSYGIGNMFGNGYNFATGQLMDLYI